MTAGVMDVEVQNECDSYLQEFMSTTSFEERIKIVTESMQSVQSHLFETKDEFRLLMSEVTKNGMRDRYFADELIRDDLLDQLNRTKKKFNSYLARIKLSNAEILAILLFTHAD